MEELRMAWEPARFLAWITWNVNVDRKHKVKTEQELRRFVWEKRTITAKEARQIERQVKLFRGTVKNKWKLPYLNE